MAEKKAEIRKDYILNRYVIITPGRAKRPRDIREETMFAKNDNCPFCPENIDKKNVLDASPNLKDWNILSLKNIFPAVSQDNPSSYGTQEVIIETPDHYKELADLPIKNLVNLLTMYANRTKEISQDKKINYVLCFKNQGSKAGASIQHTHSQIFATEITPPDLQIEAALVKYYRDENGTCPYCDVIEKEIKSRRKIFDDKNVVAFAPFASEYHYEAWIFPKRHLDNITLLTDVEMRSMAKILKKILTAIKSLGLSYNFFLHNVVSDLTQHFYLKIQPRDSVWAGVELGSGIIINSLAPEEAAKFYRRFIKQ